MISIGPKLATGSRPVLGELLIPKAANPLLGPVGELRIVFVFPNRIWAIQELEQPAAVNFLA